MKKKRYRIHLTETIILRGRGEPKDLRTQAEVQNNTQIRKNQKVIKNSKDELTVGENPNKATNYQHQKINHQLFLPLNRIIGLILMKDITVKLQNLKFLLI